MSKELKEMASKLVEAINNSSALSNAIEALTIYASNIAESVKDLENELKCDPWIEPLDHLPEEGEEVVVIAIDSTGSAYVTAAIFRRDRFLCDGKALAVEVWQSLPEADS